ncbi:RidA family protein [Arthrobacter bambusae]|uniref:RidA family protein n=1 Tax=Arthrobacter bambusae TaxID=1338426 RepID=UPI00277DD4A9|nr:Rid family hydrolase [Arthrobacter bambusae]MDQ0212311.1 2-iminobutanoate/2-iminopropanoate deaminase [Arthrobacter bambusae]MDQ0234513.1 2-iminobutanoate/2-iminopropanoate deaminase [Arthrobacter bambusae]
MNNLGAVLAAYGLDFSHVVKATVHLHHPGRDLAGFNTVYETFVETPYPARTRWVRSWVTSSSRSTWSLPAER